MPNCRCTNINQCKRDIEKITAANTPLQKLRNNNGNVDSSLSATGRMMQSMATPDNMDECVASINNMNKGSSPIIDIDGIIRQCTDKISSLQAEQRKYEREDDEYHRMQKELRNSARR